MSDDIQNNGSDDQQLGEPVNESQPDFEARIAELQSALDKATANLEKARKGENFHKKQHNELKVLSADATEWKTKYEALESKVTSTAIDGVLSSTVLDEEVHDKAAVLALFDRSKIKVENGVVDAKAVADEYSKLKESFKGLFKTVTVPDVKRSAAGGQIGGFEQELAAAKTTAELTAVLKKHGKI